MGRTDTRDHSSDRRVQRTTIDWNGIRDKMGNIIMVEHHFSFIDVRAIVHHGKEAQQPEQLRASYATPRTLGTEFREAILLLPQTGASKRSHHHDGC